MGYFISTVGNHAIREKLEGSDIDVGNARYGGQEALVIFEDVFVPWERVFMCREHQYSGLLVERFAGYHRQSYGGCKVGVGDVTNWRCRYYGRIQRDSQGISHQ